MDVDVDSIGLQGGIVVGDVDNVGLQGAIVVVVDNVELQSAIVVDDVDNVGMQLCKVVDVDFDMLAFCNQDINSTINDCIFLCNKWKVDDPENAKRQIISGRTHEDWKRIFYFQMNINAKGSTLLFQMPVILFIHNNKKVKQEWPAILLSVILMPK